MLSGFIEEMEAKKRKMVATFGKYTYKMEGIQVEQHMCCTVRRSRELKCVTAAGRAICKNELEYQSVN
jgi:hypothetical protein